MLYIDNSDPPFGHQNIETADFKKLECPRNFMQDEGRDYIPG